MAATCKPLAMLLQLLVFLLDLNLARVSDNNLRCPTISLDDSSHADLLVCVVRFGRPELSAVFPPYDGGKDLIRVRPIKIDEGWGAAAAVGKMGAGDQATHF